MPLKLYVKTWCPWCIRAQAWLDAHGFLYTLIDVEKDHAAFAEMKRLSGQSRTPTLVTACGGVLADFGPEELGPFLAGKSITP